jgi:hypothetical protein
MKRSKLSRGCYLPPNKSSGGCSFGAAYGGYANTQLLQPRQRRQLSAPNFEARVPTHGKIGSGSEKEAHFGTRRGLRRDLGSPLDRYVP